MPEIKLLDLDGTLNKIDIMAALEGKENGEIQYYLVAASEHVAAKTGLPKAEVFDGIKTSILHILPQRTQIKYWGTFLSTKKQPVPICPAADHFMLTQQAINHYLHQKLSG